jgi:hypothetical protein
MRCRPARKRDAVGWHEIGRGIDDVPRHDILDGVPVSVPSRRTAARTRLSAHIERNRVPADKFGTQAPKRLRGFYGPKQKLHGSFRGMTFSLHID